MDTDILGSMTTVGLIRDARDLGRLVRGRRAP